MDIFMVRQHYSLWIVLCCWLSFFVNYGYGLQGIPTWICLGIKSPFIEFKAEVEILSNVSVSLNASTTEKGLNHKNGVQSLGPFIYPIDQKNDTIASHIMNEHQDAIRLQQQQQHKDFNMLQQNKVEMTENPVIADMNSKKEVTIIQIEGEDEYLDDKLEVERKYIIPLALKNPIAEQPGKSQLFQDSSTNIDDLKRHILMLQNLTKNDQNFQSKFVVFPSLQRNDSEVPTTKRPSARAGPTKSTISLSIPKNSHSAIDILRGPDEQFQKYDKITIVPQVFLQNDQTSMNDESYESRDEQIKTRSRNLKRKNGNRDNNRTLRTTSTSTTTLRPNRRKNGQNRNRNNNQKRQQQKKQCRDNVNRCNVNKIDLTRQSSQNNSTKEPTSTVSSATVHHNDGIEIKELNLLSRKQQQNYTKLLNYPHANTADDTTIIEQNNKLLSRITRSHQQHRNSTSSSKELIYPSAINATTAANYYTENIDLNPDLCFKVGGLSYGQQKLCVLHTNIMPAISRGARSALQECKHQFKNRRWNCSTVEDDSVFGPVTNIGSPEMAFVHALAAAGAASFVARACRDGQLTSCGCSRSSRPKQLHDDWTWGGCGDDLEFGYKFSQSFIDVREKERKRGTRGLVSVPQKYPKIDEEKLGEDINDTENNPDRKENNGSPFKPEDLLELQEKITKEILSSKLQENEMHELQAKINRELLNSKVFNLEHQGLYNNNGGGGGKKQHRVGSSALNRMKNVQPKARSMMNLHNNEAGRRAVIKKSRITCKCHGVSGSCSLITCWQQLTSMREIGDYLREKYDEATQVKMNKRGRLQVKDPRYKVPSALDLVYLDESPDWCRVNRQLHWQGTHNRVCNKSSSGLDGCAILCCGRGYNTKKIVVKERCNCKFHWCCHVKCETCVKVVEEYICK